MPLPLPSYIPTPHLIASSRLTAPELVLNYEDFTNTLRYVATAPELVFERLVANLSDRLKATYQAECLESSSFLMPRPAHGIIAAARSDDDDPSALEASQLANQKLTHQLYEAGIALRECRIALRVTQIAGYRVIAGLEEANENISPAGPPKVNSSTAMTTLGTFATSEIRSPQEPRPKPSKTITLGGKYAMIPGILVGLTLVDIDHNTTARVSAHASAIRLDSFEINLDTWGETTLHGAACAWLALDATDVAMQYGSYHTIEHHHWSKTPSQNTRAVVFKRAYASPPRVVVWLNLFDLSPVAKFRLRAFATDVTAAGFNLHIDSWDGSNLMWTMASWLAYPSGRPGIVSGSFSTREIRSSGLPQLYNSAFEPFPSGVFETPPRVFVAINELEIDHEHNLRLKVTLDNVSAGGMTWHLDAWMDTVLRAAGASYIAFG